MATSTWIYRIVEFKPDGVLSHEWCPTATEAKKLIKEKRLNKFNCKLQRMQIGTTAFSLCNLINDNIHFTHVGPDENITDCDRKWKFGEAA